MEGSVPGFSSTLYSVELMTEYGGVCPWIFLYTVLSGTYEGIWRGLSMDFPLHCTQWNL
jgi:hypothetical protein